MIKKNIKTISYDEFIKLLKPLVNWVSYDIQMGDYNSGVFIKEIYVAEVQNKRYICVSVEMSFGPCIFDTECNHDSFNPSGWEAGSKDYSYDFYFKKDDYSFINSHFSEESSEYGDIIQKPDYLEPEEEDIYVEDAPEVLEEICNGLYDVYGPNVHSIKFVCNPSIDFEKHKGARSNNYYEQDEYAQADACYSSNDLFRAVKYKEKSKKYKYLLEIRDCANKEIDLIFTMKENKGV